MTDNNITPPQELVQKLYGMPQMRAIEAAFQAGADQELEACCDALNEINPHKYWSKRLRAARRPKPPSLKQEALKALSRRSTFTLDSDREIIRRALEALPND